MEKRLGSVIKYVGYAGIGLMFIGLMECAAFGAEFSTKTFIGYLKGMLAFSGADTIMIGIWVVLAAPFAGLVYIFFLGLKRRNFRLVSACAVIAVMLAAVMIVSR